MTNNVVEIGKARAGRITDAIGIDPGLVIITATSRSTELRAYGRPDLQEWFASYAATEEGVGKAVGRGVLLANSFDLALLVRFIREPQQ